MKFPKREHYQALVVDIAEKIRGANICFYLYGSFTRPNDFVPGRSDIDGGFILDTEFITPKKDVVALSRLLDECLTHAEENAGISPSDPGININFNLMDRGTNRDGRFLAYDSTYTDHLKNMAHISSGPLVFISEMNGMNYKREALRSAAYNLRKVRNGLLSHVIDLRRNPQRAGRSVLSSMSILVGMPKKLLETLGKELYFENGAFFETFREIFPEYNPEMYQEVREIMQDPAAYFSIPESANSFDYYARCVTATEEMIGAYVKRFPHITQMEVRTLSDWFS